MKPSYLPLLRNPQLRSAALRSLHTLATQVESVDGGPTLFIRSLRSTPSRDLMRHAFDHANPDLGRGWRHRYERSAQWIRTEAKRWFLYMRKPSNEAVRRARLATFVAAGLLVCSCAVADRTMLSDAGDPTAPDAHAPIDGATVTSSDAPSAPDAHIPHAVTLSQTSSETLATSSLGCQSGLGTAEQAYYRVFDLAAAGITTPLELTAVRFGVQSTTAITLTVRIGTYGQAPGATLATGAADWAGQVTPIASALVPVTAGDSGTIVTAPVAATIPGGARLIVEIHAPDGSTNGQALFLGASTGAETAPGFYWAPDCGATPPGTPAELGEGEVKFLIEATGSYP